MNSAPLLAARWSTNCQVNFQLMPTCDCMIVCFYNWVIVQLSVCQCCVYMPEYVSIDALRVLQMQEMLKSDIEWSLKLGWKDWISVEWIYTKFNAYAFFFMTHSIFNFRYFVHGVSPISKENQNVCKKIPKSKSKLASMNDLDRNSMLFENQKNNFFIFFNAFSCSNVQLYDSEKSWVNILFGGIKLSIFLLVRSFITYC